MAVDLSTFLVLAVIFLGIAYRHRKTSRQTDQFHIANWSASSFAVVASVIALFGAGEIATFTELYSAIGTGMIVFFLGVATGFVCVSFLADRFFVETRTMRNAKRSGARAYHINDIVYDRYGTFALVLFSALAAISLSALYLIQVIVGSELIAIGADISYTWAVIGVSSFIAVYVIVSGLEGIYSTDKVQIIGLFVALIIIAILSVTQFNVSIIGEFSKTFSALDLTTSLTLFFPGFFAVVGTDVLQRYISARSSADLQRVALAAAAGWLFLGIILIIFSAGVAGYATGEEAGFIEFLSAGAGATRVLVIVGLVCALLSTADTEAHSVALLLNRAISPHAPPSVNLSRILIAAVCVAGCVLALFLKDLVALYGIMLNMFLILGPVIFAIIFKRGNALSVDLTLAGSTLLLIYFGASDLFRGTSHLMGLEVLLLAVITSANLLVKGGPAASEIDEKLNGEGDT